MDKLLVAIQNAANTIAAPNWADIAGVCVALAAVFVAGVVAYRQNKIMKKQTEIMNAQASIAEYQNKIALFEKRLEICNILVSCSTSTEAIKIFGTKEDILEYLFIVFTKNPGTNQEFNREKAKLYFSNCTQKLLCAPFFFSEEIVPYIMDISGALLVLANADVKVDGSEKYREKKQKFFEVVENLNRNKVLNRIITEMKMI